MSSITRWIPQPKRFLYFFDLSSGTEIALMTLIINKLSGIFGVFGLLSGASIDALEITMYLYSLGVFTVLCLLTPNIRKRAPFESISFAYLYLVDSFINIAYTVAFGRQWFDVLSNTYGADAKGDAPQTPGVAVGNSTLPDVPIENVVPRDTAGVMQPESATSIFIIAVFWAIRFYFMAVVFAHARAVVRKSATPSESPFEGDNGGEGWRGKLGRAMVKVCPGYWEGDGWMSYGKRRDTDRSRFRGVRLGSLEV